MTLLSLPGNASSASLINSSTATINIDSGNTFHVVATDGSPIVIQNDGIINLKGSNLDQAITTLELNGGGNTFTLAGTGSLVMSDSQFNQVDGLTGAETLVNGSGHSITGAGTIWALDLVNNGTITANGTNNALVVSANNQSFQPTDIGFTNNGVINVTGAGMIVDTTFGGFQNSAAGTVTVNSASTLQFGSQGLGGVLVNNGVITNNGTIALDSYSGTFNLSGSGTLQLNSGSRLLGQTGSEMLINGSGHTIQADGAILQVAVTNNGAINVTSAGANFAGGNTLVNNGTISAAGDLTFSMGNSQTITNNGSINLSPGANLVYNPTSNTSTAMLGGTGTVQLNDGAIGVTNGALALTIGAGETVAGSGTIGQSMGSGASMTVTNLGTIVANGTGPLTIVNLTNYDGGTQTLSGGAYTAVNQVLIIQNLGDITTLDANTTVTLNGAGSLLTPDGVTDSLAHLATNNGTLVLTGGRNMTLLGSSFSNNGVLQVDAGSTLIAPSFQSLDTNGTLTGTYNISGTFQYAAQTGSDGFIREIPVGTSVTLNGTNSLITFDGSTDALTQLSANGGSLTLTGGRSLTLDNSVTSYCNCGSLTLGTGSVLDTRPASFINFNGGTLIDGTYNIGNGATFYFSPAGGGSGDITTIGSQASVTLSGSGRIAYGSGAGADALTLLSDNEGTFAITGGKNFTVDSSVGSFTNNGLLQVDAGSTFSTGAAAFNNVDSSGNLTGSYKIGGVFQYLPQAGAAGITSIDASSSLTLSGSGTIIYGANTPALTTLATNNGTFALTNGANLAVGGSFTNNGSMTVASGSTFSAGGQFINTSTGLQSLTVDGSGSTLFASGYQGSPGSNLNVTNGAVADFRGGQFTNVSGFGTLRDGNFTIGGTLIYDDARNSGIQTIGSTASLTLSGSGAVMDGNGNNVLSQLSENLGTLNLVNGTVLNLANGAGFFGNDTPSGPYTALLSLSGLGTSMTVGNFGNAGFVTMDKGATFLVEGFTENLGSISLDGANTKFSGFGVINAGTISLTNGATADFRSGFIPNFGAQTDTFANLQGGVLGGGSFFVGGNLLFDPNSDSAGGNILAIDSSASVTLSGNGRMLYGSGDGTNALQFLGENDGYFAVQDNATVATQADFENTGNMLVATGGLFAPSGVFTNDGQVNVAALSSINPGGGYVQDSGLTEVDGSIQSDVSVTGGVLDGAGTVNGNVTVGNGGAVQPGDAPAVLTVTGDYNQLADGNLNINFASLTDWGQLMVGSTADLNGAINISLLNPIDFQLGEFFDVLNAGNIVNDGVTFNLPALGNGLMFEAIFTPTELDLEVVPSSVPEPATYALVGIALLIAAGVSRKRRRL